MERFLERVLDVLVGQEGFLGRSTRSMDFNGTDWIPQRLVWCIGDSYPRLLTLSTAAETVHGDLLFRQHVFPEVLGDDGLRPGHSGGPTADNPVGSRRRAGTAGVLLALAVEKRSGPPARPPPSLPRVLARHGAWDRHRGPVMWRTCATLAHTRELRAAERAQGTKVGLWWEW